MPKQTRDTRLSCPHCGLKTWATDHAFFMNEHIRSPGMRKCLAAARQQCEAELNILSDEMAQKRDESDAELARGCQENDDWYDTSAELR